VLWQINGSASEVRLFQTPEVRLLHRLRLITIGMIAAGAILTLAAQPSSFWKAPQTATRFDRLPIHSSTNPMFDFLLGHGWLSYLAAVTVFGAAIWFLVELLPKMLAMVLEFTVILGLCYSGSNWIAVRWHGGLGGLAIYAAAVAIALTAAVLPSVDDEDRSPLWRLCWVMSVATAIDGILTLVGQPASYWQNTAAVHEANPLSKFFLEKGWWAYAAFLLVEIAVPWLVAMRAAPVTGWAIAFGVALGGFCGGSNWLFYEWRLGMQTVVFYGLLLSTVIVWMVFKRGRDTTSERHPSTGGNASADVRDSLQSET
jgi:hypothetical protein